MRDATQSPGRAEDAELADLHEGQPHNGAGISCAYSAIRVLGSDEEPPSPWQHSHLDEAPGGAGLVTNKFMSL